MPNEMKCPKCGHQITIDEAIVQKMVSLKVQKILDEEKIKLHKQADEIQNQKTKEWEQKFFAEKTRREAAEKKELALIKRQQELEDREKRMELENARKLMDERKTIEEKTQKELGAKYDLQNEELRKQLEDTKKALSEAQRKAHQGSQQTQGEVLELSLEHSLQQTFPLDKIEPVPKGIKGADIIQIVYTNTGQIAGSIVWESKRTKHWTEDWVQKLKDDARNIKANISVLVAEILPKDINHIHPYNGIWVSDYFSYLGLAHALRQQLITTSQAITASSGKDQKKEMLYDYLISDTFAQRVQAIVETFINMKSALDREKIVMQKVWATREVQITRLTDNTAKMYGEIQGIAGSALPEIEILELEGIDETKSLPSKKIKPPPNDQPILFQ